MNLQIAHIKIANRQKIKRDKRIHFYVFEWEWKKKKQRNMKINGGEIIIIIIW